MRLLWGLLAASLAAGELTERLEAWKKEIEEAGGHRVVVARAGWKDGVYTVPEDTPARDLVALILAQPGVGEQLRQAYSLTVSNQTPEGTTHAVLLNLARRGEWEDHEEALLAHEFGHAWIKARGYPTLRYVPGPAACLSIHATDIVQHVLIREEMDRRGIDHRTAWIRALEKSLEFHEAAGQAEVEPCERVKEAALWMDLRLGLTGEQWPAKARYEKALRRRFPAASVQVDEMTAWLKDKDLTDRTIHRQALVFVFEQLKRTASGTEMARAGNPTGH
jgi:hypothetical protein